MNLPKRIPAFAVFLMISCFSFGQDLENGEFISLVNTRIQQLKNDLDAERRKSKKLHDRINKYMDDADKKDKVLERNFERLVEARAELNKKEAEILRLSNDLRFLSEQDDLIKKELIALDSTKLLLEEQVSLNEDFITSLKEELEDRGKEALWQESRANKLLKILQNYDRDKRSTLENMVYFLEAGWKRNSGFNFHLIGGLPFEIENKLFIGLGVGFNDNRSIELSTLPTYVAFRAILNDSSFEFPFDNMGTRVLKKSTFYAIGDVGLSNSLKNNLSLYNASDLFFNVGIGYQHSSNAKVRFNTTLTYNYERFKQKEGNQIVAVSVLDGIEFNIGFYLDL